MNRRILISGASIAGLTLAHWLARYGFEPTIVERAPGLRQGGNGVDVRDQAFDVVERMGLLPRIHAAAADVRGMRFVDADDRTLAELEMPGDNVEIMRGDLVTHLHEATDAEYLFGDSITSLSQNADGVDVTFDKTAPRRFGLVIGADGMHSTTRRLAFGPEAAHLRHMGHYFAFADADATLGTDRRVTMFNRPGRMAGIYRSGNHAQAKAYFIFRSPRLALDHRDTDAHKHLLAETFAGDGWHTDALLAGATADPAFYFDALAQVRMDTWHTGRIALTGDAAWCASPASGAGAELALVGAYRLAGELAAAHGDHTRAFPAYETAQRPLVERKRRIGVNVKLMVPRTRVGARLRDLLVRMPFGELLGNAERRAEARRRRPLTAYATTPSR